MSEPTPETYAARHAAIGGEADTRIADLEAQMNGHDEELAALQAEVDAQEGVISSQTELLALKTTRIAELKTALARVRALLKACREGTPDPDPDPDPDPTPTKRFNGDPGRGKIRIGWDVEGGKYDNMVSETETIRALVNDPNLLPMTWREYGFINERTCAPGSSAYRAGQRGCHIMANWDFGPDGAQRMMDGELNGFIDTLIRDFKDAEADGINIIALTGNEFDGDPAYMGTGQTHHHNRYLAREATVHFSRRIKDANLSNVAIGTQTFIAATFHNADGRFKTARAGTYGTSARNDHPAEYIQGWNGKYTDWDNGWEPNPADFNLEWTDILCVNQYCWHGMNGYGNYDPLDGSWGWDEAEYRSHDLISNTPNYKHMWYTNEYRKHLFGATYPMGIGEFGWPVHEDRDRSYPEPTMDHWEHKLYDGLIASETVFAGIWKQVAPAGPITSSAQSMGGRYAQMSETKTKGQPDGRDSRRWASARMIQRATREINA